MMSSFSFYSLTFYLLNFYLVKIYYIISCIHFKKILTLYEKYDE